MSLSGHDCVSILRHVEFLLDAVRLPGAARANALAAFTTYRDYFQLSMQRMPNAKLSTDRQQHATQVQRLGDRFVTAFNRALGTGKHSLYVHFIRAGHVTEQIRKFGDRIDGTTQAMERRHQNVKGRRMTNCRPPSLPAAPDEHGNTHIVAYNNPRVLQAMNFLRVERALRWHGPPRRPKKWAIRTRKKHKALL